MSNISQARSAEAPTSQHLLTTCANCGAKKCADGKALNRCGRCCIQLYCSRDCQVKHWPLHKTICSHMVWKNIPGPMELLVGHGEGKEDLLKGTALMITPISIGKPSGSFKYHITPAALPAEMLQAMGWARVPLPAALGLPIRVVGSHGDDGTPNELVEAICWDNNIKSPRFGHSCVKPKPNGGMMVVREDGGKIHVKQLLAMVQYARMAMGAIEEAGCKGTGNLEKKKELVAKLNPGAFKKFFGELKEAGLTEEPKSWVGAD